MKILNDMECIPCMDGYNYFQKDEDGEAKIFHIEFDFGVVINITDVHKHSLESLEHASETNVMGLLLCMNGSVETTIDDNTYTNVPGAAVFGRPSSTRHKMVFPAGQYQGIAIGFKPGVDLPRIGSDPDPRYMLATLKDRFSSDQARPFFVPMELCMLATAIIMEIQANGGTRKEIIRRRCAEALHIIYCMGTPEYAQLRYSKNMEIVDRMCSDLNSDLTAIPNIKQMCEDYGVNEFWFIRNFKKRYGYTPYEYHKMAKHVRAAALLLTDQNSVGEISKMVGYTSQSKFSMAFKEIMGCRPKHYARYFEEKLLECNRPDDLE